MGKENIFDKFGQAINEAYIDSAEFRRQLRGFTAKDTPIAKLGIDTYRTNTGTKKEQLDKQILWTLQDRNSVFNRIDTISRHHIAEQIKDTIISDGFNDINNGNTLFIKYNDPTDPEKSEMFTDDINLMIKRTNFLDILRDGIYSEGLDYGELFLSKVEVPGIGITDIIDDINLREHIAIYSKANLLGAVRFNPNSRARRLEGTFIPAKEIAHFMLNYKRIPLEIQVGKGLDTMSTIIKEKIRCAEPILAPVVDLIKQYNQLEQINSAIEIAKAIQPILLGVGVSPEQDISKIAKQLQNWSNALNKNKTNVINNLDNLNISTLLQSMQTIELIPYDVENNANAMKQIQLNYGETNLSEKINDLRKIIALAVGIPEQYISTSTYLGQKDTKEDTIQTNPRYSMMLSRIQQLLAKGIRELVYSHLKAKYSTAEGIAKRTIDKDRIDVIFKSCTNLNDRLENENMMLRAETMSGLLAVIDSIAGSPNIPIKVAPEQFVDMWHDQMRNNPPVRDMFKLMTPEEVDQLRADNGMDIANSGNKLPTKIIPPAEGNSNSEEELDKAQKERDRKSKQAAQDRKDAKRENDGDDDLSDLLK